MSAFVQIEVCSDGTITRASARAINRACREAGFVECSLSGADAFTGAVKALDVCGLAYRIVQASALKGANKARHTREVTRSRSAQARREARKAAESVAA